MKKAKTNTWYPATVLMTEKMEETDEVNASGSEPYMLALVLYTFPRGSTNVVTRDVVWLRSDSDDIAPRYTHVKETEKFLHGLE